MESGQNALEIYEKYTSIPCYIVAMTRYLRVMCTAPHGVSVKSPTVTQATCDRSTGASADQAMKYCACPSADGSARERTPPVQEITWPLRE